MVKEFKIQNISENAGVVLLSGSNSSLSVSRKDLKENHLAVGDVICAFSHPNYPNVVAVLKSNSKTLFQKSKEEIVAEELQKIEDNLIKELPEIAKHRLKMFEHFVPEFVLTRRFREVCALSIGCKLARSATNLEDFLNMTYDEQQQLLPQMENPTLPQIPAEKIVEFATAFLVDGDQTSIEKSRLMRLPLADADHYGDLCHPRSEYIKQYINML